MATTPEGKVKKAVVAMLTAQGAWWCTPATHGYGRSGVPDFVGVVRGIPFAIETKAPGGKVTFLQGREIEKINAAGGRAVVVIGVEGVAALDQKMRGWT